MVLAICGCRTAERLTVVADSVAIRYVATEVSATMRTDKELIVTLTNPDSVRLLGQRDRLAVGQLARLAYRAYGDSFAVRQVRIRLIRSAEMHPLKLTQVLLDTLLLRWQLEEARPVSRLPQ